MSVRLAVSERPAVRRFSRQWFFGAFRTIAWVVVITLLIWVYADLQFTDERNISVALGVHAASAGNLVLLEPDEEVTINFRVKGDRYRIDSFINRLARVGGKLEYDAARELGSGRHTQRTKEVLARLPEIRKAGLEVLSAEPGDLRIRLDELKRLKSVRVEPQFTGGEPLDLKLEPERVDLLVPAGELKKIDLDKLVVKTLPVDLGRYGLGQGPKNLRASLLVPPAVKGVRLLTTTVSLTCKVGSQAERKLSVNIGVTMPNRWLVDDTWSQYAIKVKPTEQWRRQIRLLGDRIDLERLREEDVKAYIELTEAAKDVKSWESAEVKVVLPPGLKVRLDPEPIPPVDYRLEKRSASTGGP